MMLKRAFRFWQIQKFRMGIFAFSRILERIFPPLLLRRVLLPVAALMAWRDISKWTEVSFDHLPAGWPAVSQTYGARFKRRVRYHLSRVICNWPDRLSQPHWRRRFEIQGSFLEEAQKAGRPVILLSAHFGPLHLGGYYLRALGLPVATYVGDANSAKSITRRTKDRLSHFPAMRHIFSAEDGTREVCRFLSKGNMLRMAFDLNLGKTLPVPLGLGYFSFCTGPLRLAAATGSTVIPYVIAERAPWDFVLHLGEPVPAELLAGVPDLDQAAAHVLGECCRFFRQWPDQTHDDLLTCFSKMDSHPAANHR
jgi:lauroyl/myristoyl acyltransferase